MKDLPLITFALFTYNSSEFVREAVQGAFDQDYQNLEIIISDDCSQDNTFEIIEDMVRDYSGSHTIRTNRNHENLGLGSHVNKMFAFAQGELIVMAAGDDVSLPERTRKLVEFWLKNDKPSGLGSFYQYIDDKGHFLEEASLKTLIEAMYNNASILNGEVKGESHRTTEIAPLGATAAWSREIYLRYGEMNSDVVLEDLVLSYRAHLISGVKILNEKLVNYRTHTANLCSSSDELRDEASVRGVQERVRIGLQRANYKLTGLNNILIDLSKTEAADPELISFIENLYQKYWIKKNWWTLSLKKKITCFWAVSTGKAWEFIYFLPFELFCKVYSLLLKFKKRVW